MALPDDIAKQLVVDLKKANSRKEQSEIISSYHALNNYSRNTILRAARKFGWKSGRKTRSDKGKLKANLTDEQITKLIKIRVGTRDKKYKAPKMPLECVIQIAEDQKLIPAGEISVAQLGRLLREMGLGTRDFKMDKDKGDPIRMKVEYPNDCWFVDTTICAQWYLDDNGKFKYQSVEDYKNKREPGAGKQKLTRYMIVDQGSGAFYPRYYIGNENIRDMADFLWRAFSTKPDINLEALRGLPRILFGDKGSVNRAAPIQNMLRQLDIEWRDHMPGNPRAKGAVETIMWYWQRWFETRLMLQKAKTLQEINEWTTMISQYLNSTRIMTRHKMTRAQAWNIIPEERLRMPPDYETYQKLLKATMVKRLVHRGRIIRFEGEEYQIGGSNPTKEQVALVGEKVEIGRSPWKWEKENRVLEIIMPDGTIYEIEPEKATILNYPSNAVTTGKEFKGNPDTKTQKTLKEKGMIDGKGQVIPIEKTMEEFQGNMFYVRKERLPCNVEFMPKTGSPMIIEIVERRMPRMQGLDELERLLGRELSPAESRELLARLPMEVSDKEIKALAKEMTGGWEHAEIKKTLA